MRGNNGHGMGISTSASMASMSSKGNLQEESASASNKLGYGQESESEDKDAERERELEVTDVPFRELQHERAYRSLVWAALQPKQPRRRRLTGLAVMFLSRIRKDRESCGKGRPPDRGCRAGRCSVPQP
ncbi:uncharacterized protein LOC110434212 isoform X2 [Sorghum bicolor]|uniref:uncharacterized protein LOC110434212 isoform X2 n=1 Tax=Sorghum bicolor TaxID=4558 RepID=UPI000B425964|nr:uncharacterized protein LOC110434212 isoform X2 [Sorghum bicolor]|eukprot:XP_021313702.1 uncharacterized protein LOC110434212 isoform X2 [Sorghum bicolor]